MYPVRTIKQSKQQLRTDQINGTLIHIQNEPNCKIKLSKQIQISSNKVLKWGDSGRVGVEGGCHIESCQELVRLGCC